MAPTQLLSPTTVPATKAIKKKVPLISSKHGRVPMVLTCFETKLENTGFGLEDLSLIRYQAVGPWKCSEIKLETYWGKQTWCNTQCEERKICHHHLACRLRKKLLISSCSLHATINACCRRSWWNNCIFLKTSHEFSFSKLYWPASCAQERDVAVIQSAMGCGQF